MNKKCVLASILQLSAVHRNCSELVYRGGPGCPGSRWDSQLHLERSAGRKVFHVHIPHGTGACFSLADMAPGNSDGFSKSTAKPATRSIKRILAQLDFYSLYFTRQFGRGWVNLLAAVTSLIITTATATTELKCLTVRDISVCLTLSHQIMRYLPGRRKVELNFRTKS